MTAAKPDNTLANGCLIVGGLVFVLFIIAGIFGGSNTSSTSNAISEPVQKNWYEGGTLHKAKIREWKLATEENKLATCGDFVAHAYKEVSLPKAVAVRACINEACRGINTADNMDVAEIAASCIVLLNNQ